MIKKLFFLTALLLIFSGCTKTENTNTNTKQTNTNENTININEMITATIKTNKGDINVELYKGKVPNTVDNFVKLSNILLPAFL